MELKQTLSLRLEPGARMEKIVPSSKAFLLVGMHGLVCQYERTDEKHDPYVESRRLSLGNINFTGGTVYPSEEKMVLLSKSGRMLSMPLDVSIDQIKSSHTSENARQSGPADDEEQQRSEVVGHNGVTDLTSGGFHSATILSSDIAYERCIKLIVYFYSKT